jgi:hypothetical protein
MVYGGSKFLQIFPDAGPFFLAEHGLLPSGGDPHRDSRVPQ